jgi:hypothetical protein
MASCSCGLLPYPTQVPNPRRYPVRYIALSLNSKFQPSRCRNNEKSLTDGRTDWRTDGLTDGRTDARTDGQMDDSTKSIGHIFEKCALTSICLYNETNSTRFWVKKSRISYFSDKRVFPWWKKGAKGAEASPKFLRETWNEQIFGSGSLYRWIISPKKIHQKAIRPNTVSPNAIWPKVHLTESPYNRRPFDRKFVFPKKSFGRKQNLPKVVWPKIFGKWSFDRKTCQMTEMKYDLSVKLIFGQTTLCAIFFGQMIFFVERRFGQMTIFWKNNRSYDFSVKWTFGQTVFD